jgi:hypothetical protein
MQKGLSRFIVTEITVQDQVALFLWASGECGTLWPQCKAEQVPYIMSQKEERTRGESQGPISPFRRLHSSALGALSNLKTSL